MKFKLIAASSTVNALTSDSLHKDLIEEFGEDYYTQPICNYVCEFVKHTVADPNLKILHRFMTWVKDDSGYLLPFKTNGHYVIQYGNKIYDYTSDQYQNYGIVPANGLRVLTQISSKNLLFYDDTPPARAWYTADNYYIMIL